MKKYAVELTDQAEAEAEEAYLWIQERSPQGAARWWSGLVDAILSLEELPERRPLAPESDVFAEDIRQLFHGRRQNRYRVLFIVEGRKVTILHVRHAARRPLEP